ncbi:MAG: hypothetical protein WBC04_03100 [Candidatus Acidiferrales bacterium]
MVREIMRWVAITALLLPVAWRPSANGQMLLRFLVCAGAVMVVLALFSLKRRFEIHYALDNRPVSVVVLRATENAPETLMPDTINTGTMPIEGGALLPESLQFESEPWTFFYRAGEVIRELRKASGKQSKYGSEGNMVTITPLSVATILNG